MKRSAGILVFRYRKNEIEFFLVHPGGPFWKNKEEGAWSVPKGEYDEGEPALDAARREFKEETGIDIDGRFIKLNPVKLKSGKLIQAWAVQGDLDAAMIHSNEFELEWPPRSGKKQKFPEVDKAGWFNLSEAEYKINKSQFNLLLETKRIIESY